MTVSVTPMGPAELAGATDATLTTIARVPDELLVDGAPTPAADAVRPRFWAAPSPMKD